MACPLQKLLLRYYKMLGVQEKYKEDGMFALIDSHLQHCQNNNQEEPKYNQLSYEQLGTRLLVSERASSLHSLHTRLFIRGQS